MKIFVAGSTGAIGKYLIPQLIEAKHQVVALVRTHQKGKEVETLGAEVSLANALNDKELTEAIKKVKPEVIIHELTALAHFTGNFRRLDKEFTLTNHFRTKTTDVMLAAAHEAGTRRFIAQSFCGWPYARKGGPVKSEEDPLDPYSPKSFTKTLAAIQYLEKSVCNAPDIEGLALRYGFLYGPGTGIEINGDLVNLIQKRKFPLVGNGAGIWSFIHVQDVAKATVTAVSRGDTGVYNITDDEPAPVSDWLPYMASVLGAKPPRRIPVWLARLLIGEGGVSMMTKIRGGSNAKAKRDLGWHPSYPSWRIGFTEGFANILIE
jgi:nucleoside-diphosphate-sugar epimerase